MTRDEEYMRLALAEAEAAEKEGEVPVGAVVVFDGEVVAKGHNTREKDLDIAGHAEIVALKKAALALGRWSLEGCALYVTLEPCLMCAGAIRQSRISTLVFGARDAEEGAVVSRHHVFDQDNGAQTIQTGVLEESCAAIIKRFFLKKRGEKSKLN